MSINAEKLPSEIKANGKSTIRLITLNGEPVEFSDGFTELNTKSYEQVLASNGFSLE